MKFLYPGHNYLGPGNKLENGTTVDRADKIAKIHDYQYSEAKYKEDIFQADESAIDKFGEDYKYNTSIPSLFGNTLLSAKHSFEKLIGHTVYPFNLPSKQMSVSNSKPFNRFHPYSKDTVSADQRVPSAESTSISADNSSNSVNMDVDQTMQGDQATPDGIGGAGGGAHGQTARIYSGFPQEVNFETMTFKKTYRFRSKAHLPAYTKTDTICFFQPGGICSIPVEYYWFYLSPEEFNHLKCYESAEMVHVKCNIFNYGVRLPFHTNDADSNVANASAQYPLAQWIGLENDYIIAHREVEAQKIKDACLGKNIWEEANSSDWSETFTGLSARASSRDFFNPAIISLMKHSDSESAYVPNVNQYAHVLNGTMNLGPVFSYEHKVKNGTIHIAQNKRKIEEYVLPRKKDGDARLALTKNHQKFIRGQNVGLYVDSEILLKEAVPFTTADYDNDCIENQTLSGHSPSAMKPFLVGLQELRNSDKKLIDAVWEFACDTYCTIKVRKGTQGRYWLSDAEHNNGPNTVLKYGNQNYSSSSSTQRNRDGTQSLTMIRTSNEGSSADDIMAKTYIKGGAKEATSMSF